MQQDKSNEIKILLPKQKIIFCDIDGTLLDDHNNIHDETLSHIKKLINESTDYHFALASGRNLAEQLLLYRKLNLKSSGLLLGSNGAQIYSLKSHQIIYEQTLPVLEAERIYKKYLELKAINKNIALLVAYTNSSAYVENFSDEMWAKYNFSNIKTNPSFTKEKIVMITIMFLQEKLPEMLSFLKQFDLTVLDGPNLTSINAKNVSKAHAIEYVLKKYNIEHQHVAVIGDSKNDLCMFELPNVFSITHTSAKPYLQKIATEVIDLPKSQFIKEGLIDFQYYINQLEKK